MPPYPDKATKSTSPSCEYVPVSGPINGNPMPDGKVPQIPKLENGQNPVPQPALPLTMPYLSGDSDSDDQLAVHPTSTLDLSNVIPPKQTENQSKLSNGNCEPDGQSPEIPEAHNTQCSQSRPSNSTSREDPAAGEEHNSNNVVSSASEEHAIETKMEDSPVENDDQFPDCTAPANSEEASPSGTGEAEGTTSDVEPITVSKNCLDGVLQHLSTRISELEHIRERKRARVERLSSTAYLAQTSAAMALWPQAAAAQRALTAPNSAMLPNAGVGVIPTALPPGAQGCPISRSGTPFLHGAPDPSGAIPPPPPPADAADRKQSRYWTADEHQRFLAAIKTCGPKNYVQIAEIVGTRNAKQVRTHAQKFQKKLEREEAKRRENMKRHGGHPGGPAVSAAAVAAVAAAAAAMQRGAATAHHLTTESSAHRAFASPFLLPFQGGGAFPVPAVPIGSSADGSSSTNDVSNEHQHTVENVLGGPSAQNAAVAAVAAEAAALGGRIFSAPAHNGVQNGGGTSVQHAQSSAPRGDGETRKTGVEANVVKTGVGQIARSDGDNAVVGSTNGAAAADAKEEAIEEIAKCREPLKNSVSKSAIGMETVGKVKDDKSSRHRSYDELSGICAVVKEGHSPPNHISAPRSVAVGKPSETQVPRGKIDDGASKKDV